MKRIALQCRVHRTFFSLPIAGIVLAAFFLAGCNKAPETAKPVPARPSDIRVEVRDGGPVVLTTSTAEFQVLAFRILAGDTSERWKAADAG